jgi:hypothetical protein
VTHDGPSTAIVLTLAACPADDTGDGGPLGAVPARMAAAICAARPACDAFAHIGRGNFDCEPRYRAEIENRLLPGWQAAVERGEAQLDEAGLAACLAGLAAGDCHAFDVDDVYAGASAVLVGQVDLGRACDSDDVCAGEARCDTDGQCPGACVALGNEGAACDGNATCADGLECVGSEPAFCTRRLAAGATCSTDGLGTTCQAGTLCQATAEGNVCITMDQAFSRGLDEACGNGIGCKDGLACELVFAGGTAGGVCIEPVAAGGACSTTTIPESCLPGFDCGETSHLCEPLPAVNEACTVDCASGLVCSGGRCGARKDVGEACTGASQCWSGSCLAGTCAAPSCAARQSV